MESDADVSEYCSGFGEDVLLNKSKNISSISVKQSRTTATLVRLRRKKFQLANTRYIILHARAAPLEALDAILSATGKLCEY